MPQTPDDIEGGITDAGKVIYRDEGMTADAEGESVYRAGAFLMRDALGVFNPRTGGTTVALLAFRGDGHFRAATGVDIQELNASFTISDVVLRREIAGRGGTTEIDILLGGVSIWNATPANRPKVLASGGDAQRVVSGAPDVTAYAAGTRIEMVILSAETGNPQDLVAFVRGS